MTKSGMIYATVLLLEHEGEWVGLPELVGLRPLEAADLVGMRTRGSLHHLVARFVEHTGNRDGLAGRAGARNSMSLIL